MGNFEFITAKTLSLLGFGGATEIFVGAWAPQPWPGTATGQRPLRYQKRGPDWSSAPKTLSFGEKNCENRSSGPADPEIICLEKSLDEKKEINASKIYSPVGRFAERAKLMDCRNCVKTKSVCQSNIPLQLFHIEPGWLSKSRCKSTISLPKSVCQDATHIFMPYDLVNDNSCSTVSSHCSRCCTNCRSYKHWQLLTAHGTTMVAW